MAEYLSGEQIKAVQDIVYADVSVPEWGGTIRIRSASAAELEAYDRSLVQTVVENDQVSTRENYENSKARLLVICVVDEQGRRIFNDRDANWLGKKSAKAVERVFEQICELSGRTRRARKEMAGNSEPGQNEDSHSSSPGTSE